MSLIHVSLYLFGIFTCPWQEFWNFLHVGQSYVSNQITRVRYFHTTRVGYFHTPVMETAHSSQLCWTSPLWICLTWMKWREIKHSSKQFLSVSNLSQPMWKGYLSHRQTTKVQASLHIGAVLLEVLLFAHTIKEIRGSFRQRVLDLIPLDCCP